MDYLVCRRHKIDVRNNWELFGVKCDSEGEFWDWLQKEGKPNYRYKLYKVEPIGEFTGEANGCVLVEL